jgi:hypothetical protein
VADRAATVEAPAATSVDLEGKRVSFGRASSTSGHLVPRDFLLENGIEPERRFARVAFTTRWSPRRSPTRNRRVVGASPGRRVARAWRRRAGTGSPEGSARSAGGPNDLDLNRIAV